MHNKNLALLLFAENTIWSQMHLKQTALERQEDLFYSSSLSFQGDSASASLASEISQVCIALLPSQSSESSGLEIVTKKPPIWKCVILDIKARDATYMQIAGPFYLKLFLPQTSRNRRPQCCLATGVSCGLTLVLRRLCSQMSEHKCV